MTNHQLIVGRLGINGSALTELITHAARSATAQFRQRRAEICWLLPGVVNDASSGWERAIQKWLGMS